MKRLLVISHTPHYKRGDQVVGWGPTIVELDHLSQLFEQVVHIAPLHLSPPPDSALPYHSPHICFKAIAPTGGPRLRHKAGILHQAPRYLQVIRQEMTRADVLHVRCPANISLLTLLYLARQSHTPYRWFKYAGNWQPQGKEPWPYALQRWLLKKGVAGGVVTVNGRWPNQPPHIYAFNNPSLTAEEVRVGKRASEIKTIHPPYALLFVGALTTGKGVKRLLQIAKQLYTRGIPFTCHLVGDGPERPKFESWVQAHDLTTHITFHGWLPKPMLADFYSKAHFLVFPSATEGWPKVISEAMAYGVVPIAGNVSCIPQILKETGAGAALPVHDIDAFVNTILAYGNHPQTWQAASHAGVAAALRFTYGAYTNAVKQLFEQAWGIMLPKSELEHTNV
ncbi:MAG: glycosyltransferase [Chloroflexi bacterium]|nr:MAG: glycosyltransferase [Chloroflexota bacterium]